MGIAKSKDIMGEFLSGYSFEAYNYFGAHEATEKGLNGCIFRVYAPNAAAVSLIGEFSDWKPLIMNRDEFGTYSLFVPGVSEGMMYKYRVRAKDGTETDKADPYAFLTEIPPACASVVYEPSRYRFTDDKYIAKRSKLYNEPMNIYEIHLGSWIRRKDGSFCSYTELIPKLIPYLKKHNYTHVELMPVGEHPFYGSWGYQCSGFFAADSRYGTPDGLMRLVDECHFNNIGVIFDFVPVHFAADESYMHMFDGTPLYEYDSRDMMYNEWGSCNFCHSKPIVSSFLLSAANFLITVFHADGLRMDAISNMIYWQGDPSRGVNTGAVDFMKRLNSGLHRRHGNVMLIAEDSTDFLKVTAPVEYDGLGFDYKWNMGWMNDTLNYFRMSPSERRENYHMLTFSMQYFYSELFLLPFSHDECVHGKATIMQKMWGDYENKFPQCRELFLYMAAHPGKKLSFMGDEIGQLREWDETREPDRELLKYPLHDSFLRFFTEVMQIYLKNPALYNGEYDRAAFRFLEADNPEQCVYAWQRTSGGQSVVFVMNTSDRPLTRCRVGCNELLVMKEMINSDSFIYSGMGMDNPASIHAKAIAFHGKPCSFEISLNAFSAALFEVTRKEQLP